MAIIHLDESCLGNGRDGQTPGGAGGLIEVRTSQGIQRRDFYLHAVDTTNNRMALAGAIAALQLLARKGKRLRVLVVSDSEYLVKGMREWIPGWIQRNWRRKGGPIENLPLWRALVESARQHDVQWTWVRGHQGHAKNEYANDLAVAAATEQKTSNGTEPSGLAAWLATKQTRGLFPTYDPDAAFAAVEQLVDGGEPIPLAEAVG
ncbi:MAG: ribonuclease HI [Gemmatimonadales bacterium]|nr:ribonuclease HI [Gemmatimonadales bacterium]